MPYVLYFNTRTPHSLSYCFNLNVCFNQSPLCNEGGTFFLCTWRKDILQTRATIHPTTHLCSTPPGHCQREMAQWCDWRGNNQKQCENILEQCDGEEDRSRTWLRDGMFQISDNGREHFYSLLWIRSGTSTNHWCLLVLAGGHDQCTKDTHAPPPNEFFLITCCKFGQASLYVQKNVI